MRVAVAVAALAMSSAWAVAVQAGERAGRAPEAQQWAERVADARQFAAGREGRVGFAVVDEDGDLHGHDAGAHFESASVVKVMLMVAYLRQVGDHALGGQDRGLLGPMITHSDNGAADAVYAKVGAGAVQKLARDAGLKGFAINGPFWGSARITADGQARFLYQLESYIPRRHRGYALRLLANVIASWGLPRIAPKGWRVHLKGGWAPEAGGWKVNQVALLTRKDRRLSLAVLTRGGPGKAYGVATVQGVMRRLLGGYE